MSADQSRSAQPGGGIEARRLDAYLEGSINAETRRTIWESVAGILDKGPLATGGAEATGLALGYVQSGKTTSICALAAAAADSGYRIVIALLGSTNLLLAQNRSRIEEALGIPHRDDFRWVVEINPNGGKKVRQLADWLLRDRVILIPVLKHAGRISRVAEVLSAIDLSATAALIIDDEADQASLNNEVNAELLSRTYEAITNLRRAIPRNLYIQYTATPYAPMLIEKSDHLAPQFVEFLHPGPGYTGGREFFIDFAPQVVRIIPALEEQNKQAPIELPASLVDALAVFVSGAALLLSHDPKGSPVSMLVHSTHRNDIQERYHFLIDRLISQWKCVFSAAAVVDELPKKILLERKRLVDNGATDVSDIVFLEKSKYVIKEINLSLLNSREAVDRVNWKVAPIHILVGGNKLDRGFTVEGLTVTYMNRKHSDQIDTLEQRARAFGYRRSQLPYCQFFASKRTVGILRDIVFTEYDLRARLQDHIDSGGSVSSWADEVGLLVPRGTRPTRLTVIRALSSVSSGWRSLRNPFLSEAALAENKTIALATGVFSAPRVKFGRLSHRVVRLPLREVRNSLLAKWIAPADTPGWRAAEILEFFDRHPDQEMLVPIVLLEEPSGIPRVRKWDSVTGFVNLFQGKDIDEVEGAYAGDRTVPNIVDSPDQVAVQLHRLVRRDYPDDTEILTLAVYVGERMLVRRADTMIVDSR